MANSDQEGQGLANKTDEEIQAELEAVKKKFYDRMDTQLEKDLIIEEREKLALERRNLDIQMEFLKQKMKKVYQDELDIREYLEPEVNNSGKRNDPGQNEKLFLDITKNGPPVTPPKTQENDPNIVAPRKSRLIDKQELCYHISKTCLLFSGGILKLGEFLGQT